MRKFLILLMLVLMFGLLQASVATRILQIGEVFPDLLLILVTYIAFKRGSMEGQYVGFASGLCQDIFSPYLYGMYAFIFTVVGFIMGKVQRKVYSENFITAIILVFLATLLKGAVLGILALFFKEASVHFAAYIKNNLLFQLFLNPLAAGPLFWLLGRFVAPAVK